MRVQLSVRVLSSQAGISGVEESLLADRHCHPSACASGPRSPPRSTHWEQAWGGLEGIQFSAMEEPFSLDLRLLYLFTTSPVGSSSGVTPPTYNSKVL